MEKSHKKDISGGLREELRLHRLAAVQHLKAPSVQIYVKTKCPAKRVCFGEDTCPK